MDVGICLMDVGFCEACWRFFDGSCYMSTALGKEQEHGTEEGAPRDAGIRFTL